MITLEFLGATRTVTGSRFLVRTTAATILVDSGLFQGSKRDRRANWEPFPAGQVTTSSPRNRWSDKCVLSSTPTLNVVGSTRRKSSPTAGTARTSNTRRSS